eukprot:scaffold1342_cov120-Isochrysis_galbana.AAC.11
MLAMPDSAAGQMDYADILGAHEFASDTTRILSCIDGFESLIGFVQDDGARAAKAAVLEVGSRIAALRTGAAGGPADGVGGGAGSCRSRGGDGVNDASAGYEGFWGGMPGGGGGSHDSAGWCSDAMSALIAERRQLLRSFRELFYLLPEEDRDTIDEFLTSSNLEIVGAKVQGLARTRGLSASAVASARHRLSLPHSAHAVTCARSSGCDPPTFTPDAHTACTHAHHP